MNEYPIPRTTPLRTDPFTVDVFYVKNWDLSSANKWAAIDQNDVAAQNNANPLAVFNDHAVVLYNGKIYDPSYGTGPFNTLVDWEDASVDGYGVQFINGPHEFSADFLFWIGKQDTKGTPEVKWKTN